MRTIPGRLVCASVASALVVAGCGSSSSSGATSSLGAFTSSFSAARPELHSISVELSSAITEAARNTGAQSATRFSDLAERAAQEASALEALNPPARFNTELRALGSALEVTSADLSQMASAATQHDHAAAEATTGSLRQDAANLKGTEMRVSGSLGLPAG